MALLQANRNKGEVFNLFCSEGEFLALAAELAVHCCLRLGPLSVTQVPAEPAFPQWCCHTFCQIDRMLRVRWAARWVFLLPSPRKL